LFGCCGFLAAVALTYGQFRIQQWQLKQWNEPSNFLTVANSEFKIQEWQAAKKLEHAVCFGLKPEDFGFSKD